MRQWVVTGAAHAGGVRKMTDSMPALMNDYIAVVPEAQKVSLAEDIALLPMHRREISTWVRV